jgi:transposase
MKRLRNEPEWSFYQHSIIDGGSTMNIKVLGIDLAKTVFQLHGLNGKGKSVLRKRLTRDKLVEFIANLPPCLIGMEACSGAHYWARRFEKMGHTVKLISPQFVKPFVKSNKNDRNDARAIAEAVSRPDMKFVAIKTLEQQDILLLHRTRQLVVKQRTAQVNQIRGLLAEYGVVIPKGIQHVQTLLAVLENNQEKITPRAEAIFKRLYEQFTVFEEQVKGYDAQLEGIAKQDVKCREIMKIEGIGPLTASAIVATIGDAKVFKNGREVAAWLGLVPKQHSSGNRIILGGISKRGDRYVRTLLIHGARAVVSRCQTKTDKRSLWINDKEKRRGHNKASVALANKNARIIGSMLKTGECYRPAVRTA